MTTLTDRLAYSNLRKVFLLEVTAGEWLKHWTLTAAQTYTYETTSDYRITAFRENGVALTEKTSIATVEANSGSWWWDQATGKIYCHPTNDDTPYNYTMQGIASFYFANEPRIYNGVYYEPRIRSMPSLSMRIEETFGDVGQLGAGKITLTNEDGFFDSLADLQWDAGGATLLLGVDDPLRS